MLETFEVLKGHIEKALIEFSKEENLETLLEAKREYFSLTGQANEEDEDFESRMNSFNDWYVLQFVSNKRTRTIIKEYIKKYSLPEDLGECLMSVNHSLFEYTGKNLRRHDVLKDILHDKKIVLPKDFPKPALIKGDLFVGRVITMGDQSFLLDGLAILPSEVKSTLKKQSKKVRKLGELHEEFKFLMQVESLKNKWLRYGHIDVNKIFQF